MIENIYLDMDGVLCDFANEAAEKKYLNLKTRKVNWQLLNTEGEKFWENLKWIDEAKKDETRQRRIVKMAEMLKEKSNER